ncbi:MAG: hypothetical protein BAA02_04570 [Paenibacillaceae bacterium ZCTH02-B3]|nr:MAG: hypothetical protein BAA02_04570 [Paenibacillaceae bacterium ZCTH02-B3]
MRRITAKHQLVVCGGGLAGFCAAVAAARQGIDTCLVHNRPVFGGNSSSEIRVTPHGAASFHAYARETGIISELLIEERARNHEYINENGWTNSVWDLVLYDMAVKTENLTFHLNTHVTDVIMAGESRIRSVICQVANAETELELEGDVFIDCTGDGIVAVKAGCEWRMGAESREEFGEPHAPLKASRNVMGSSIHFKAVDVGYPVPFEAPEWAVKYENPKFFYELRHPLGNTGHSKRYLAGYWWLEIGTPFDTIHDNEKIRHELTRHTLGVWDWIKNRDPHLKKVTETFALEWIGQVPGKRESRRIMGRLLLTELEILNKTEFHDEIAYGGWFVDVHAPGGLLAREIPPEEQTSHSSAKRVVCGPYGIPLRILIAKDVDNLLMAGRNVSVTQTALGTVRVQGTTSLMGQAAGTAAAVAIRKGIPPAATAEPGTVKEVQQILLREGCFLPHHKNEDPLDLAREAKVTASSEALLTGAGPDDRGAHRGLSFWKTFNQSVLSDVLSRRRGQWIAVGTGELRSIAVCLSNLSDRVQPVHARLMKVQHIWDYRTDPAMELRSGVLHVPPGSRRWIEWEVNLDESSGLRAGSYVRLDLLPNEHVEWHRSGQIVPGHVCAYEKEPGEDLQRYDHGITMSFRVDPPQPCFRADNVTSGVTRPYQYTNLWRSDPHAPLPQWVELEWNVPRKVSRVELTFAGNLLREYHSYEPLYRDPQCVRNYSVSVWTDGGWKEVVRVEGNYQRQRKHDLAEPAETGRLRVTVYATNGDPSAAIYEIRCY